MWVGGPPHPLIWHISLVGVTPTPPSIGIKKGVLCQNGLIIICGGNPHTPLTNTNGAFTPEQDNDKTKVEPVHFYYAFHTRFVGPGVKGIIQGII